MTFDDGSVGWYEAGWGPMMSEIAFFVKDVVGPKGSVSIAGMKEGEETDDVDAHSKAESIKLHHAELDDNGEFLNLMKLLIVLMSLITMAYVTENRKCF